MKKSSVTPHANRSTGTFGMIGNSDPIKAVRNFVITVAPSNANILILGESGVGKELVARAIHHNSLRHEGPFVAVNCAAIAQNLVESELFGHERGAFTGALKAKPGYFERAQGGTVFLDEIGELPIAFQAKLLRVIQERELERVGATSSLRLDVRIISATNRNLEQGIDEGWFRRDLYYRLKVISVTVDPLRNRLADIPILARHFLAKHTPEHLGKILPLSAGCMRALRNYTYPGNVRELDNIIHRAVVLAGNGPIQPGNLPHRVTACLKQSVYTSLNPDINADALLKSLKKIMVETDKGKQKHWHAGLRCVTIEQIHQFLVDHCFAWFSRRDFEQHLKRCAQSEVSKYKTAGVYLNILTAHNICKQNGQKANRSAYKLHDRFISESQTNHNNPG